MVKKIISWGIVVWICYVFLGSLPYKFTNASDTVYIFSIIGTWLSDSFLGEDLGQLFTNYGAYVVGSFELLTSLLLLSPILIGHREKIHCIGGAMASAVMSGAVFFHSFSPLGWAVLHEGQSDGGSLARAALSILILGLVLMFTNIDSWLD